MQQQSSSRPSSRPQVRLLNLILGDATEERDPVLISHSSSAGRAWKILQRAGAFIAPLIMMTPSSCAALRTRRTGADNRKTARERMLPQASNCWICSGLTARRWPTSQICFVNRPSPNGRDRPGPPSLLRARARPEPSREERCKGLCRQIRLPTSSQLTAELETSSQLKSVLPQTNTQHYHQ